MQFNLKNLININKKFMKMRDLLSVVPSLEQFQNETMELVKQKEYKGLPVVTSFKIAKLLKSLDDKLSIYNKIRLERMDQLGTPVKDDRGEVIKYAILPKNKKTWEKEFEALMEEEVEIADIEISMSELDGLEKVSPFALKGLALFIKE